MPKAEQTETEPVFTGLMFDDSEGNAREVVMHFPKKTDKETQTNATL